MNACDNLIRECWCFFFFSLLLFPIFFFLPTLLIIEHTREHKTNVRTQHMCTFAPHTNTIIKTQKVGRRIFSASHKVQKQIIFFRNLSSGVLLTAGQRTLDLLRFVKKILVPLGVCVCVCVCVCLFVCLFVCCCCCKSYCYYLLTVVVIEIILIKNSHFGPSPQRPLPTTCVRESRNFRQTVKRML